MEVKVSIVIMSHLSDLQGYEVSMSPKERQLRFNFVKYLILNYSNTDTYINPNAAFKSFQAAHPKLSEF